jgi:two-component system sensor histidine kinase KdpD
VLGLTPDEPNRFDQLEQRRRVDAFAAQTALALERARLAEETSKARREIEAEQLRSTLLSSVSHDLRTPLAVITGSTSTLLQAGPNVSEATRHELLGTVLEEAEHLNRLIRNLLDMTRLESGAVKINKEWLPLEEVVGAALNRLDTRLTGRDVHVDLPRDLPLVACDVVLVEQALINLLENAAKYSVGPIEVVARPTGSDVVVEVADRGPGIPAGEEARVFEKFHRAAREGKSEGVGLGLTICRAIVAAHGGRIWVQNRPGGGASFKFALPNVGQAPQLPVSEPSEGVQEQRA